MDDASAIEIRDALYPLTAHEGARVLVDLATFGSVDVDLVGVLTGAAHLLLSHGGELVVVARDPRVRHELVASGLGLAGRVEPTLAKGMAPRAD
jgi:anti-anti-sigma factor